MVRPKFFMLPDLTTPHPGEIQVNLLAVTHWVETVLPAGDTVFYLELVSGTRLGVPESKREAFRAAMAALAAEPDQEG